MDCYGELSDNEILESIKETTPIEDEDIEDEGDNEEDNVPFIIPSTKEALEALNVLQKYCMHHEIDIIPETIEYHILKGSIKAFKQISITEYFS